MQSAPYTDKKNDTLQRETAELMGLLVKPSSLQRPFSFLPAALEKLVEKHHRHPMQNGKYCSRIITVSTS